MVCAGLDADNCEGMKVAQLSFEKFLLYAPSILLLNMEYGVVTCELYNRCGIGTNLNFRTKQTDRNHRTLHLELNQYKYY